MNILVITGNYPYSKLRDKIKCILKTEQYKNYEVIKMPEKEKSEDMQVGWFKLFVENNINNKKDFIIYTYSSTIIKLTNNLCIYSSFSEEDKNNFNTKSLYFNFKSLKKLDILEFIDIKNINSEIIECNSYYSDQIIESSNNGILLLNDMEDLIFKVQNKLGKFSK